MKKFLLSLAVFGGSAAYVFSQYMGGSSSAAPSAATPTTPVATQTAPLATTQTTEPAAPTTATPTPTQSTTPTPTPTKTPAPTPTPTPTPVTKPKGQYTDGTYTGSQADAYYGIVQVQVTISGGKLTDVIFLSYPSDRSTSRYINSQAMPLLKSEAIQAQSANVSGVSGASDTSQAFIQSLGDALSQAKA